MNEATPEHVIKALFPGATAVDHLGYWQIEVIRPGFQTKHRIGLAFHKHDVWIAAMEDLRRVAWKPAGS